MMNRVVQIIVFLALAPQALSNLWRFSATLFGFCSVLVLALMFIVICL
jgi:hypothetical protein